MAILELVAWRSAAAPGMGRGFEFSSLADAKRYQGDALRWEQNDDGSRRDKGTSKLRRLANRAARRVVASWEFLRRCLGRQSQLIRGCGLCQPRAHTRAGGKRRAVNVSLSDEPLRQESEQREEAQRLARARRTSALHQTGLTTRLHPARQKNVRSEL